MITHFNKLIAKHGRLAFLIMGIVVIVPFVFFYGAAGRSMARGGQQKGKVGKMYGKKIKAEKFRRHMNAADITFFFQRGRLLSESQRARPMWIRKTLKRMRALHVARQRGLDQVSKAQVDHRLNNLELPQQLRQRLSAEKRGIIVDRLLASRGVDEAAFRNIIKQNIIIDRLEDLVTSSVLVSPAEARREYIRNNEKVQLQYKSFKRKAFREEADIAPSTAQVDKYFEKHGDEIQVPERKRVLLASFPLKDYQTEVTEKDIKSYYENNSERFDDKPLAKVKENIREELRQERLRKKTRGAAAKLLSQVKNKAKDGNGDAKLSEAFRQVCEKREIEHRTIGPFPNWGPLPEVGDFPKLRQQVYQLTAQNPLSEPIFANGRYYVACWLETVAPQKAEELTAYVKHRIRNILIEDKCRQFYKEHVAPFRRELRKGKSPQQLISAYPRKLSRESGLAPAAMFKKYREYMQRINRFYGQYYKPAKVRVLQASCKADDYRDGIEITEKEMRQYYNENRQEFKKEKENEEGEKPDPNKDGDGEILPFEEVKTKVREKVLNQKAMHQARVAATRFSDSVYARLQDQEDVEKGTEMFRNKAQKQDIPVSKSGWLSEGRGRDKIATKAHQLSRNHPVSEPIKTEKGFHVLYWLDRKPAELPKFDEVSGWEKQRLLSRVKKQLKNREARRLARQKAQDVYDKLQEKMQDSGTFADAAEATGVAFEKTSLFKRNSPPRDLSYGRVLTSFIRGKAPQTLLPPRDVQDGAVLIYLLARKKPDMEGVAEQKSSIIERLRRKKKQNVLQNFYRQIRKESNTKLASGWQPEGWQSK